MEGPFMRREDQPLEDHPHVLESFCPISGTARQLRNFLDDIFEALRRRAFCIYDSSIFKNGNVCENALARRQ